MATSTGIQLGGVIPILRVNDAPASIDYYVNRLGFAVNFSFPDERPFFASVKRGRCELFLCEGD